MHGIINKPTGNAKHKIRNKQPDKFLGGKR